MLSKLTERKIAQLFYIIGSREQEIEKSREILCQNLDFETYTAFKHLDLDVRSSISATDIQLFLEKHHLSFDISYIYLLISQYDSNLDGRLSLNEFLKFVLPSTNEYLRDSVNLRVPLQALSLETQYLLLHLFELELIFHEEIEKVRCDITLQSDFSLLDSFRIIDYSRRSLIDRIAIKGLLSKHGFFLSEEEVNGIFRRLDNDGDGAINYVEYVDTVMPKKNRNISPLKKQSPARRSIEESSNKAQVKYQSEVFRSSPRRNSSPLRQISPQKISYLDQAIRPSPSALQNNSRAYENISRNSTSLRRIDSPPRRYSPVNQLSPLRQVSPSRKSSPLRRSSPLRYSSQIQRSSPLRQSPGSTSYISNVTPTRVQNSSYSSAYRNTPVRQNTAELPAKTLSCYRISPPRNSSPLRSSPIRNSELQYSSYISQSRYTPGKNVEISPRTSPLKNSFEKSSYPIKNNEEDLIPQRQSPLKSTPLRNASLRESASKGYRVSPNKSSPLKNSSVDFQYSSSSKFAQSLRNSNL